MCFVRSDLQRRFLCSVVAGSFSIFLSSSYAADTSLPADTPASIASASGKKIQQIEIKGSLQNYDNRRYDTATKIVVTQEEILKHGDTTIAEVLKRLPGVTIDGVQGRGGEIRMRGLGNGYTQILLNGEPSPPGFSLDALPPDLVERIEIMRAATAEYSTQAIAGGINIILKKVVQTAQREIKVGGQEDNGRFGETVNMQMSDRKGPLSYTLAGGLFSTQFDRPAPHKIETGYDINGVQNLLRNATETSKGLVQGISFSPRVNWAVASGEVVTWQTFINANHMERDETENDITAFGVEPDFSNNVTHTANHVFQLRSDLSWSKKIEGGAKLDAKFGNNWNHRAKLDTSVLTDATTHLDTDRRLNVAAYDRGFFANGKYSTPYVQNHVMTIGWDSEFSGRSESLLQKDVAPPGNSVSNIDDSFSANVKRLAWFAQDEWSATQRLSVYFGLRWEGIYTRADSTAYQQADNASRVWSPLLQALWKLPDTKNDQVRFGLTRTYKAPSTNSLIRKPTSDINTSQLNPDSTGNPDLKPELAWGLDLAYEHYIGEGGLLSASTFVRRIEDKVLRQLFQMDGQWLSMPVNSGTALTKGIELEAKLPLHAVIDGAPAVEIRANLSRYWSTLSAFPGPNNRLDQQTPFSANLGLDYKMKGAPLTVGGNYSFQTGGPVRTSLTQWSYSAPKRVLDMYGLWKFDASSQLRLSLANALHQDNIGARIYSDEFDGNKTGLTRSETTTPTSVVARINLEIKF